MRHCVFLEGGLDTYRKPGGERAWRGRGGRGGRSRRSLHHGGVDQKHDGEDVVTLNVLAHLRTQRPGEPSSDAARTLCVLVWSVHARGN